MPVHGLPSSQSNSRLSKEVEGVTRKRQAGVRTISISPTEVAKEVGRNVRKFRKDLHMALTELAERPRAAVCRFRARSGPCKQGVACAGRDHGPNLDTGRQILSLQLTREGERGTSGSVT